MITNGNILTQVFENGHYSPQQQESSLKNAVRIYNKLPNPENHIKSNVGIVVGRVQSGKTANIITLSALALDNGHKIVVLFLSDTNNLLTQNTERFMENFDSIDGVEVVKKSKDGDFDAVLDEQTLASLYEDDTKLVICSLKHTKHIQEINELISKSPYKDDYSLIIDDEGDDIGLNTATFSEKFVQDKQGNVFEAERTSTNCAIVGLKKSMTKLGYISLTATPEANILLQDFQQLAPDYCVTMEPNEGYTGLLTFHGDDSKHIVEIKDYVDLLENNGLPESFEDAFIFFIAGCIARKQREGTSKFKHSMMVHPCGKIENQDKVFDKIKNYVEKTIYNLKMKNKSGIIFISAVQKYYEQVAPTTVFDEDQVFATIKKMKMHLVNCAAASNDLKKAMKLLPYHMVIGGNMLDRGITIDGLAVTYMIRMSKQGKVDTLLQRARWFGYKQSYIDLCRVYLPRELKAQFYNIIEAEESVWQFLYECDHNNLSPKNMVHNFQVPTGMKLAAANKAMYITTNLISFVRSQSILVHDHNRNKENLNIIEKIDWHTATIKKCTSSQIHRIKTISVEDFRSIFKDFNFSEEDDAMSWQYLETVLKRLDSKVVDLWDMRYDSKERRSTDEYRVKALLQGYSENKTQSDPDYYVGDRQLKTDNLSIQIHHVVLKNSIDDQYKEGDTVIMLAAVLPKGYIGGGSVRKISKKEIADMLNS